MPVRVVPAGEPPTGVPVGRWPLTADPSSAGLARRYVTQAMDGAHEAVLRRATLVTSELVSNGIEHARGGLSLAVHRVQAGWVVSVTDDSSAPPQVRDSAALAESGRGLLIVARVSEQVGWARTPTGKVVWATFADGSAGA